MDIELIPATGEHSLQDPPLGSLPMPTARCLCIFTRPTEAQLRAVSFDSQLYFSLLKTDTLGRTVLCTSVISSTQNVFTGNLTFAQALPNSLGTVCVAQQQTKGKGRYLLYIMYMYVSYICAYYKPNTIFQSSGPLSLISSQ